MKTYYRTKNIMSGLLKVNKLLKKANKVSEAGRQEGEGFAESLYREITTILKVSTEITSILVGLLDVNRELLEEEKEEV